MKSTITIALASLLLCVGTSNAFAEEAAVADDKIPNIDCSTMPIQSCGPGRAVLPYLPPQLPANCYIGVDLKDSAAVVCYDDPKDNKPAVAAGTVVNYPDAPKGKDPIAGQEKFWDNTGYPWKPVDIIAPASGLKDQPAAAD